MRTALLKAIAARREELLEFTSQLVRLPTENPPGNEYARAVELISTRLVALGFSDTCIQGDCVLSFIGSGPRTLYFSGHYDVVPAQSVSQFEPVIQGANLFGRGSSDMKSGLAAMMFGAAALRDYSAELGGRIGLVFVPDEETAGERGSRYLAQRGLLGLDGIGMLTPEPTGGVVWNANRGAISLRVNVKGKSAHVGRQHEGANAFERMLPVAQSLLALKEEVEQRRTAFHIAPDAARRSILMLGGRAEAGSNFNLVPDRCTFTIDRRINPEEDFEEEKRRLLELLTQFPDLEIETLQEGRSSGVGENCSVGRTLARSIEAVTGRPPQFEMCPGLLEIRFYAERGIPAFAYGPGLLTVSHGPNEFVPIQRMVECAQVYALTAIDLLGQSGK